MARRKQKKNSSHLFGMLAVMVVLIAVVCALSIEMISLKERDQELARQEAAAMQEIEDELAKQDELEEERIYIQTKQFIEAMAKEKWGLIMPGEIILKPSK